MLVLPDRTRIPIMEYHQEQKDLFHHQNGYLSSGLLTPSSSAYEGRRDSIASAQSSISYAQSYSSSSYYSPKMPPTPTSQRDPGTEDFIWVQAPSSYDGRTQNSGDEATFGDCRTETPVTLSQSMPGAESHAPFSGSWVYVGQNEYGIRQETFQSNDGLPAAGDFRSAFDAELESHCSQALLPSTVEAVPGLSPWSHPYPSSPNGLPDDRSNDLTYGYAAPASLANSLDWTSATSAHIFPGLVAPDTMMPKDSVVFDMNDGPSYIQSHSESFDERLESYDSCSTPLLRPQPEAFLDTEIDGFQLVKKEDSDFEEHDEKPSRSIYVSPTGAKSVKKERRSSRASNNRKKPRAAKKNSYVTKFEEGDIHWDVDGGDIELDKNGRLLFRPDGCGVKKLTCKEIGCDKKFARPEHLKRHEDIHIGHQRYKCRLKNCPKKFNRWDNCLYHYLTHVKRPQRKSTRNDQFTLQEVETQVRVVLGAEGKIEDAQKIIDWLRTKVQADLEGKKLADIRAHL